MRKTPLPETPAPRLIRPHAVYFADDLRRLLRFGRDTLARERAAGRLRVAERCGRLYVLGEWILQWIREGEIPAPSRSE